jgi:hypothetical protein
MGSTLDRYVDELFRLTASSSPSAYDEVLIKEIGDKLGKYGGQYLMAAVGYRVIKRGRSEYSFSFIWNGLHGWLS